MELEHTAQFGINQTVTNLKLLPFGHGNAFWRAILRHILKQRGPIEIQGKSQM
jgi:hypothetical protein